MTDNLTPIGDGYLDEFGVYHPEPVPGGVGKTFYPPNNPTEGEVIRASEQDDTSVYQRSSEQWEEDSIAPTHAPSTDPNENFTREHAATTGSEPDPYPTVNTPRKRV